ncbi:GNAT family N-acetyltransferase [Mangrovicella endophytica]|uniref:GNAT family N-acetyltransferase n=1 Tax=Mangrovicella endophytica TaxID=2066697 RepID=UPI000C9E36DB|nr:N-acetyltransferase [Mangrovicella endophytica]
MLADVRYVPETPACDLEIDAIAEEAFGPGRFARAAERVREMARHDRSLSFVALLDGEVIGSVRQTPIAIGGVDALMLGPLAVRPAFKSRGAGKALMRLAAEAATKAGERSIILVGDPPYYEALGYRVLPRGSVLMPGPVDPARLLGLELSPGALAELRGRVTARR